MRRESMIKTIPAVLAAALVLAGCSSQSVTYDAGAVSATETPIQTTESVVSSAAEAPAATETPSVTATAAPTVTETPTVTPEPTMSPITPIEVTKVPDPDEGLDILGEKAEGSSIFKVRLVNGTGRTITWISAKDNFTDYFPANLLPEDGSFDKEEKVVLYFDADHAMRESADREEKAEYEIRINLKTDEQMKDEDSEGIYRILHDVPFSDFDEAEICFDGDVPYLKYTSKADKTEKSTLDMETERYEEAADSDDDEDTADTETSPDQNEETDTASSSDGTGSTSEDASDNGSAEENGGNDGTTDAENTGDDSSENTGDDSSENTDENAGTTEVPEDEQYTAITDEEAGTDDGEDTIEYYEDNEAETDDGGENTTAENEEDGSDGNTDDGSDGNTDDGSDGSADEGGNTDDEIDDGTYEEIFETVVG